eukprot:366111-Chlamydomonas_euryale.AAC.14
MAARQDRHASAPLLQCCCKRRRIRDGKIAVALASASNDVDLTEGGSTLSLGRPCQDPCRGLCALNPTTAGCGAVTGTPLKKRHWAAWAHTHGRCAARPPACERGHAGHNDTIDAIGHHGRA